VANSDRIVLFGGFNELTRKTRTGVKKRIAIEIESEPILFNLNELALGQGPAEAIKRIIEDQIRGIAKRVSQATIDRRQRAHKSENQTRWYQRRYTGGRTGETPPDPNSTQWGNDSGRLANGVFVRENKTNYSWTVNVPANRLDERTFGSRGFMVFLQKLAELVPALGNPGSLLANERLNSAIDEAMDVLIVATGNAALRANAAKRAALRKAQLGFGKALVRMVL